MKPNQPSQGRRRLPQRTTLLFAATLLLSTLINSVLPAQQSLLPPPVEPNNAARVGSKPVPRRNSSTLEAKTPRQIYDETVLGTVWIMIDFEDGGWSKGTGFVIDKERRLVMTNHHVVDSDGEGELGVYFPKFVKGEVVTQASYYRSNVTKVSAQVIDTDHNSDLALIQVDSIPDYVRELPLATKSSRPADRIHTIGGNPVGSSTAFVYCNGSVRGIANRPLPNGGESLVCEADLDSNGGNSGGPWVNDYGQVVAVNEGTVHTEGGRQVDGVKLGVDILAVHDYLGEILPLLPADTYQKLIDFGNRHYFEGRYDVALNCFSHAIKMEPTSLAYSERAWSYYQLDRYEESLNDLKAALDLDDENVSALRVRSLVYKYQDRTDEAIADVNRAIALEPKNALSYYDRGTLYYSLEDYDAAVSDFSQAISIDSENVSYFQYRADALQEMGRHEQAIEDLKTAINLDPSNSYTVWLFGYSMFYTGDFASAEKAFMTAYELDPADADCLTWAADSARNQGELNTAVGLYNKAIELDEDQAWAFFGRGLCYKAAGNQRQAEADFAHAEQLQRGITDYEPRGSSVSNDSSSNLLPENQDRQVSHKPTSPVAGLWVCDFTYNRAPARMAIFCDNDGNYEFGMVVEWPNGQREKSEEKGTYRYDGSTITTTDQDGVTSKLRCTVNGDRLTIYIEDFNGTFNFKRYEE